MVSEDVLRRLLRTLHVKSLHLSHVSTFIDHALLTGARVRLSMLTPSTAVVKAERRSMTNHAFMLSKLNGKTPWRSGGGVCVWGGGGGAIVLNRRYVARVTTADFCQGRTTEHDESQRVFSELNNERIPGG